MLHEFLSANRELLVQRCREKVATRRAPEPTPTELEFGVPLFLDQLVETLKAEEAAPVDEAAKTPPSVLSTAGQHGGELLRRGFTVDQVVHDYGDLCQAVTELAAERHVPIGVDEFRTFNRCLDGAIADAVTAFGAERDRSISAAGERAMNERLGELAHELRNLLNSAILAFEAIKTGAVAVSGATGGVLGRSLVGLRDSVDRSLADVRLTAGLSAHREMIDVAEFIEEVQVASALDAKAKQISFAIEPIEPGLVVVADRHMLASALSNLLQNAFKFSPTESHVTLRVVAVDKRVQFDVEDECGGLPVPGEQLFAPFEQRGRDRSGVGLGLSITRRAAAANGGTVRVRDVPGHGCVFTIDLPRG